MRPQVALRSVFLVVVCGALALAGCGGADRSASELIQQTFGSDRPVDSGRLSVGLQTDLKDSGAIDLKVSARFAQGGEGQLPKFDGTLALVTDSGSLEAGAISTGDRGYLVVAGQPYEVSAADWKRFTKGYAESERETDEDLARQPTLGSLGIHPEDWLVDPEKDGEREVGGVETIHLTAGVDVAKMLDDVVKIAERNGVGESFGAKDAEQLEGAVRAASVEVDTGKDDERLRRLVVHLELTTGTVDLSLEYADLGEPQQIAAPRGARPISELTEALSAAGGQPAGGGDEYAQCMREAAGDVAKLQDCARYL